MTFVQLRYFTLVIVKVHGNNISTSEQTKKINNTPGLLHVNMYHAGIINKQKQTNHKIKNNSKLKNYNSNMKQVGKTSRRNEKKMELKKHTLQLGSPPSMCRQKPAARGDVILSMIRVITSYKI